MFTFIKKPFEKIRARKELIKLRDQALSDAKSFGFDFKATFTNWYLSSTNAYSRKTSTGDFSKLERDCEDEVERILRVAFGVYCGPHSTPRLNYSKFENDADVAVVVNLHGKGIAGGPYSNSQGRQGYAMTGAEINGTISLCPGDLPPFTKTFKGTIFPPASMPEYQAWGDPPFRKAIRESNLQETLEKMLITFYSKSHI